METFLSGLDLLMRWDVALALIIGSVGGVVIGAIPGVGAAVAIAILLPATFSLDPIVGLTVLLGIYGSSMYDGALLAVLINTPGTAVNALTTYDGYPMTKKGQARRALALAYSASFWGGIFGIVCLIFLSPLLALIAPHFGSREIFLAALLGIILVVLAHRGQIFAAGGLAAFGIFLHTVGLDVKYNQRMTFEQTWLTGGVDLIVVVLGLFALSQAFLLLADTENSSDPQSVDGSLLGAMKEILQHKRVATVSGGFGVLMGMIPGAGEFTAQFMSYTSARRSSKTPDAFGTGAPEGLIASEAANNAVPAAAMILLNLIVIVFLIFSTNLLTKIIRVPTRFLGLIILTLSFVGVFSLRNSAVDCAIAAGFGVLGLVLKRLNLPTVPIILGMVLGGIMEVKLRSSMIRVKDPLDFVDRPIAAFLAAMIVLVILLHIRTLFKEQKTRLPEKDIDHDIHETQER